MTPQMECLGKTSPVLRVSTQIYGVSEEVDGKTFIFRVNLVSIVKAHTSSGRSTQMRCSTQKTFYPQG